MNGSGRVSNVKSYFLGIGLTYGDDEKASNGSERFHTFDFDANNMHPSAAGKSQ